MAEETISNDERKDQQQDSNSMVRSFLRAVYESDSCTVLSMLKEGVPIDVSNTAGLQALHFAAKTDDTEILSLLIKYGAPINATSKNGNTALHVACLVGNTETVKFLLHQKAAVNIQSTINEDVFTPLYMASQTGNQEIVTLLLAHGANPLTTTKNGFRAEDIALRQGHHLVASLLHEYSERLLKGPAEEEDDAVGGAEGPEPQIPKTRPPPPPHKHRAPAACNRDVVPFSPRHSPLKTQTVLNQRKKPTSKLALKHS